MVLRGVSNAFGILYTEKLVFFMENLKKKKKERKKVELVLIRMPLELDLFTSLVSVNIHLNYVLLPFLT